MGAGDLSTLVSLAGRFLHAMQLEDGLFCEERVRGDTRPHGRSLRYSLMTYIGLAKGDGSGFDLEAIRSALWSGLEAPNLRPGDLGLFLWADGVRGEGSRVDELVARADRAFADAEGVQGREGQEVAWLAIGLLRNAPARESAAGSALLRTALDELLARANSSTGLLAHYGDGRFRRRFANFATQIYGLLALSAAGAEDEQALPAARALADRLIALQLADGGWPWLYDVDRGTVVERYEVYSVHQHAMAPMGLLELFEATGERRYADAAAHGLGWIFRSNELGLEMVDEEEQLVYRSIRRRRPFDRLALYASTATSLVARRNLTLAGRQLELNATCRPYELGWLLEAWCGREHLADRLEVGSGRT
jgi:hypothetical protein